MGKETKTSVTLPNGWQCSVKKAFELGKAFCVRASSRLIKDSAALLEALKDLRHLQLVKGAESIFEKTGSFLFANIEGRASVTRSFNATTVPIPVQTHRPGQARNGPRGPTCGR